MNLWVFSPNYSRNSLSDMVWTCKLREIILKGCLPNLFNLLLNFCLHLIFVTACGLVAENRGCCLVVIWGLLIALATLVRSTGPKPAGFSGCSTSARWLQPTGSVVRAQRLDARHVESSWTRNWTNVLCMGRWVLIQGTTREVLPYFNI